MFSKQCSAYCTSESQVLSSQLWAHVLSETEHINDSLHAELFLGIAQQRVASLGKLPNMPGVGIMMMIAVPGHH